MVHWVKVLAAFLMTWIRTPGPIQCKERIKSWFVLQPLHMHSHHHIHYINNRNTEVFLRLFFGGGTFFWENAELSTLGVVTRRGLFSVALLSVRYVMHSEGWWVEENGWSTPSGRVWREPDECLHLPDGSLACSQGHTEETLWQGEGGQQTPGATWRGKPKTILPTYWSPHPWAWTWRKEKQRTNTSHRGDVSSEDLASTWGRLVCPVGWAASARWTILFSGAENNFERSVPLLEPLNTSI